MQIRLRAASEARARDMRVLEETQVAIKPEDARDEWPVDEDSQVQDVEANAGFL